MRGTIHQLNASRGGVPKLPLEHAEVGERGITADSQADKRHHGSPDQALCLYALEVIESLQAEGHPIYPGSTGENVTLAGVAWADLRPGARLRLGRDCLIEVTGYASPCKTITASFSDGDFNRINQQVYPGASRLYAKVIAGGGLVPGDPVMVLEETSAARLERRTVPAFRWPRDFSG